MCGIVALFANEGRISGEALERATRRLSHRGPDFQKTWTSADGRVGLGHARLRIIDLVTGDQPIANETDDVHIVVNGEFYDFKRIREELAGRGHRFRTQSDSEIALHLYEEHGLDFVHHLRGEFALVLWDARSRRLVAARDRFGVKPLYYALRDGLLHVASEVKALFAAGHPAGWDEEAYYQHLFVMNKMDRTLFAGVRQVPPAHCLVASGGALKLERYWDLDYPRLSEYDTSRTEPEMLEELRAGLEEAVRLRLVSDVPVGCYLSGGVDSSVVLGVAARAASEPFHAFTVSFDHADYDEQAVARETAERFGAVFHLLPVGQVDFTDHLATAVWHAETIGSNANGVARYLQSKAVRDAGYRVALSGDGGDELFAGYVQFRLEKLAHSVAGKDDAQRAEGLREIRRLSPNEWTGNVLPGYIGRNIPSISRVLGFTPIWMQTADFIRSPLRGLLAPDYARRYEGYDVFAELLGQFDYEGQLAQRDPVLQALYILNRATLPNQILFAERLDMAHGVEVRTPLFDHKLFEIARRLPVDMLIRGMVEKYALREVGRPYMTETVYARGKQPFLAPHSTLDPKGRLHELIQSTIRGSSFRDVPFFDQKQMVGLLDSLPAMEPHQKINADPLLMWVLTTCILHDRFLRTKQESS